jgi:hypothetical protein
MYCGNQHNRPSPNASSVYDKLIVSDSRTLESLTKLLENKKINIEEGVTNTHLQSIVWNIIETGRAGGFSEDNKTYIMGLPNSTESL